MATVDATKTGITTQTPWVETAVTPTPSAGAFGSASAKLRTQRIGKTVFYHCSVDIQSVGTAGGTVSVPLPYPPASIGTNKEWNPSGRESRNVGYSIQGWVQVGGSPQLVLAPFSGNSLANNNLLNVSGFYETSA